MDAVANGPVVGPADRRWAHAYPYLAFSLLYPLERSITRHKFDYVMLTYHSRR